MKHIAKLVALYGAEDLVQDAHIYGGGLMASVGLFAIWWPLAPLTFGGLLIYIGLRR